MEAAARFAEILERILPKCVDECRKIKLHPNNRSILHDLKVVEQEIGDLDDESKLLYAERLAQIEKACMLVADNQVILARMETQGYFQKWSKEHRDLLKQTKGESLRAKHLAKVTSQDAKTHKALQTAQTKNAIDTLGETATKQGIDPRDLVHSVQNHAKAERIAINNMTNNFNITINPEPKKTTSIAL